MATLGFQTNDPAVIPDKDATVKVDVNGAETLYVVKAGQPVPPWLVDVYQEQFGKAKAKADND